MSSGTGKSTVQVTVLLQCRSGERSLAILSSAQGNVLGVDLAETTNRIAVYPVEPSKYVPFSLRQALPTRFAFTDPAQGPATTLTIQGPDGELVARRRDAGER